jgi:hypothetical protein
MTKMHIIYCPSGTKLLYSYILQLLNENLVLRLVLIRMTPSVIPIIFLIIFSSNGSKISDPFKRCENNVKMQSTNQECKAIDKKMGG